VAKLSKTAGNQTKAVSGVTDVVIRASPNHAPHTLPIICKKLQEVFKVFTSAHVHSSLPKGIPNKLKDFLPASNCASRSKADLCVTLIWTNGNETEMATSPTSSLLVKGEINLLRYFARRFNLFNANEMTEIHLAQAESLLDSTYCEAMWGTGNLSKTVSSKLEPILKKSKFLATGDKISLVDAYVYALFTGEINGKCKNWINCSPIFTDWLKRCEQAINGSQVVSGTGPTTKKPEKNCSSASAANKTHAKSKSKSPTKRFKQPKNVVEIPSNQPGATLEHQWPEIESVYLATETMIEQLNENPIALISEKLDGSNLSVSSSGIISSRRKIIAVNPSSNELKTLKFAGEPLTSLEPLMKTSQLLAQNYFPKILSNNNFTVTIFGEWIQCGTASSKEDKFCYAEKGLEKGELYAFGLGLTFEGQNMSSQDLKRVESTLKYKGFAPAIVNDFIILVLNGELKHLFNYYNVMTVPILNTLPFVKMFDKMADDLLRHEVEGFIITIPSKGIILKWKGCEDNDPRRVESFIDITDHCKLAEAIGPLNQVLQESILYNAHGRKRYHDPNLSTAYQSARSKFPRLDDILSNFRGNEEKRQKIIEGYKFTIVEEITKDFGKAFGCTKKSIEAFVNHEVKV